MFLYDTSILSDIIYDARTFEAQILGTEKEVKMNKQINAAMPINNDRKAGVDTEIEMLVSEAQEILTMLDKVNLLDAETTVQSDVLISASNSFPLDEVISVNQDSGFKYIHYVFELPIATL